MSTLEVGLVYDGVMACTTSCVSRSSVESGRDCRRGSGTDDDVVMHVCSAYRYITPPKSVSLFFPYAGQLARWRTAVRSKLVTAPHSPEYSGPFVNHTPFQLWLGLPLPALLRHAGGAKEKKSWHIDARETRRIRGRVLCVNFHPSI